MVVPHSYCLWPVNGQTATLNVKLRSIKIWMHHQSSNLCETSIAVNCSWASPCSQNTSSPWYRHTHCWHVSLMIHILSMSHSSCVWFESESHRIQLSGIKYHLGREWWLSQNSWWLLTCHKVNVWNIQIQRSLNYFFSSNLYIRLQGNFTSFNRVGSYQY